MNPRLKLKMKGAVMKSRRLLVILLVLAIVCFTTTNQPAINTIDNIAYVIAMGVDVGTDAKIKLSLQIAIPSSNTTTDSVNSPSHSSSTVVKTVDCNTIDSGINLINGYISKKLSLAFCKIVVFSEELASVGIINYVSSLTNDIEFRPTCNMLISKCDAKYFLENSKPILDDLSSKYYEIENSSKKNTGYTEPITLLDFYNDYYDTFGEPYTILGNINNSYIENIRTGCF